MSGSKMFANRTRMRVFVGESQVFRGSLSLFGCAGVISVRMLMFLIAVMSVSRRVVREVSRAVLMANRQQSRSLAIAGEFLDMPA